MRRALTEGDGEMPWLAFTNARGESLVALLDATLAPGQRTRARLVMVPGDDARFGVPRQAAIVPSSRPC